MRELHPRDGAFHITHFKTQLLPSVLCYGKVSRKLCGLFNDAELPSALHIGNKQPSGPDEHAHRVSLRLINRYFRGHSRTSAQCYPLQKCEATSFGVYRK